MVWISSCQWFEKKWTSSFRSHKLAWEEIENMNSPISINGISLQYSCLEKSHGCRSLVGCSPWGCEESDTAEWLDFHFSFLCIEGNGNPLQCSSLENPRDGVAQSRTWLKCLSSISIKDITFVTKNILLKKNTTPHPRQSYFGLKPLE